MKAIFWKELNSFLSSLTAYIIIGAFLVILGLFMWVFRETSILDYNYAGMDQLFTMAPIIFIFLIPAITMRSFAEEIKSGTLEVLMTKPLTESQIITGKFFANICLVCFALLPTIIYYYSVYQLGSPKGNLDTGSIIGSYIGLIALSAVFVAIGLFASALTKNQVAAFVIGSFLCFFFFWGFDFISRLPIFFAKKDLLVQQIGIYHHYESISRGVIDSRDIVYFISLILLVLFGAGIALKSKRG